jgi:hypothetical protein
MGSSKTPEVIHPGEAAVAAMGTAAAGEKMSLANQPVDQYGNLLTTEMLGPAQMQTQQALANQAALQGAKAQMDIQSRVDPQAYAQRQMRMNATNQRLGRIYGVDPTAPVYSAPGAYQIPGSDATPDVTRMAQLGRMVASNLSYGKVSGSGGDPTLVTPGKGAAQTAGVYAPQSYF